MTLTTGSPTESLIACALVAQMDVDYQIKRLNAARQEMLENFAVYVMQGKMSMANASDRYENICQRIDGLILLRNAMLPDINGGVDLSHTYPA